MSTPRDRRFLALSDTLSQAASFVAMVSGFLVILGWLFRVPGLRSIHPLLGTMRARSALCLILAGAALAILHREQVERWKLRLAQTCIGLLIAVSVLTLGQNLFGWKSYVDQIVFNGAIGTVFPGTMPTATALTFLFLGLALAFLDTGTYHFRPAEFLTFAAVLIVFLAAIGYGYAFVSVSASPAPRPLAFHTLLIFMVLSFGILAARRQRGFVALAVSETVGGVMMRQLWPAAVAIPVVVGWLIIEGQRAGFYPAVLNLPFYALAIIVVFSTLIWITGSSLHRIDIQRQGAEEEIRRLNTELEQRVVERTAQLEIANTELRRLEERYRLLFQNNPHPTWVYDLETLHILDVNDVAIRHYGYSREEFLNLTIKDIRPAEDVPAVLASVAVGGTQVEMHGEWRHRKKDGTLIAVEIASHKLTFGGKPARLVVATDITERKRAEQALRESEERFRSVSDTAADAILTADTSGKIVYFNRGAERIFGFAAAEVLGKPLTVLMPERFRRAHEAGLRRYLSTGEAHVIGKTVELAGQRKDGTEFPLEISLSDWKTREAIFFTGILSDITQRKQYEREILDRSAQLEVANKELEAFSYSVSHDLRAPLRGIDGFSQILQEDYSGKLDAAGLDALKRVRAAAQHMAQLIDDMLNLSRVTRTEMHRASVNLSALAQSIADGLHRHEPGRAVDFVIGPGIEADGDPRLLRVVLDNLLGNAWKFTSRHDRARIEFGQMQCDGRRAFFVRDDGAGFDQAYADRLFGAFQRLHGATEFPGTGVGLATVQRIVHRHGGSVWAEGAIERGATFYFALG